MLLDNDYAYAIGRIRVIEKKLLDKTKYDRMIDSKSASEALKIILEVGYGESIISDEKGIANYESILEKERSSLYNLLRDITDGSEIFNIFLLKNDCHNIKVILKSEFQGRKNKSVENESALLSAGFLPIEHIKTMIRERNFKNFHPIIREAIESCIDTFNRTGDPQQIDLILDKACFMHMNKLADEVGHHFIKDILGIIIDLTNINIFLRIKTLNMPGELLKESLIPGGTLNKEIFSGNLDTEIENFLQCVKNTRYEDVSKVGVSELIDKGSFTKFEKLADDYLINYVKRFKYKALGLEPLIGYLIAKENEIKNIRIIMVGKTNNISSDQIRERMRISYA